MNKFVKNNANAFTPFSDTQKDALYKEYLAALNADKSGKTLKDMYKTMGMAMPEGKAPTNKVAAGAMRDTMANYYDQTQGHSQDVLNLIAKGNNSDEAIAAAQQYYNGDMKFKDSIQYGIAAKRPQQYFQNHPVQAIGQGVGSAINLAGLFDNDKVGGQLIGAAAGTGISALLGKTPMGIFNGALIGGSIGTLFDTLRAKQEESQRAQKQMDLAQQYQMQQMYQKTKDSQHYYKN